MLLPASESMNAVTVPPAENDGALTVMPVSEILEIIVDVIPPIITFVFIPESRFLPEIKIVGVVPVLMHEGEIELIAGELTYL